MTSKAIVVIGTSAGGVTALQQFFSALPANFRQPIIVVQHLPATATVDPALIFGRTCRHKVFEAIDKMPFECDGIYFAPPGYHLLIERDCTFSLTQEDPVHFARPSIDVLFESAVAAFGAAVCGVLLTGANADGAAGLRLIAEHGGKTFVQDPKEAECQKMPESALMLFDRHFVCSLKDIAKGLGTLNWGEMI